MHVIRLRGPWNIRGPTSQPELARLQMPITVEEAQRTVNGPVITLQRRFNRPTGLEPEETVALRLLAAVEILSVTLNNATLSIDSHGYCRDIDPTLLDSNLLAVELELSAASRVPQETLLDVQLEISQA